MSLTPTAETVGAYSTRYTWSGTAPYDVYLNGDLYLDQTSATTAVIQYPGETVPYAIEVRDATDSGLPESVKFSPNLRLQWRGQAGTDYYKIETYTGGEWVTQQIAKENGAGYYSFVTVAQGDATSPQWRVVPVDARKYEGDPVSFTQYIVRNPEPPAVAFSYDAGTGDLTVSAA